MFPQKSGAGCADGFVVRQRRHQLEYLGDYSLAGTTIKVYIKGENTLYVFVPGQSEYELAAAEKDKFVLKKLTGYSVQFMGNEKGEITELMFIQPNGNFKATNEIKL